MSVAIEESEKMLSRLTRAEKAQVLHWLVQDLGNTFAGIEHTPGVAGGVACVGRTRIPVWLLEKARQLGSTDADILRAYPTLQAEDVANAWAYVRARHAEISAAMLENDQD